MLNLNDSPIEKRIRVVKHDSYNNKIVAQVGQKRLTNEELTRLSEWLNSIGIKHYCWYNSGKISFQDTIEIIDALTKEDIKRKAIKEEREKREAEKEESLQKLQSNFSEKIQDFVEGNFGDRSTFAKVTISKLLHNEISPAEVGLRWGLGNFETFIQRNNIDMSSIDSLDDLWECVLNIYNKGLKK